MAGDMTRYRHHAAGPAAPTPPHTGTDPIPVAVSQPVMPLVTGPMRAATVLATHRAAAILCCDGQGSTPVVTLLSSRASGVPNGVRTTWEPGTGALADLVDGDTVIIGRGRLHLPDHVLRAARTIRTRVPSIRPADDRVAALAAAAAHAPRGVPTAPVDALREALRAGEAGGLRTAVVDLIGLGTGSTPGGDDVVAGTLAGLLSTDRTGLAQQIAIAALDGIDNRTPLLSADLLRLAARGHVCTEAAAVIRLLDTGHGDRRHRRTAVAADHVIPGTGATGHPAAPTTTLEGAITRLLRIGHTSGADLATGIALGLTTPDQPLPRQPRWHTRAAASR